MAEDFGTSVQIQYLDDGSQFDTILNDDIGSADTDDGFWNDGDLLEPFSFFQFAGYYEQGGNTFLVFDDRGIGGPPSGQTLIASPTATVGQFPATFQLGDMALTTTPLMTCFAVGTLIATPSGERAVETLAIGDLITTGDDRVVPVKWIGRQCVHKLFTPTERFEPVRVQTSALGDGLPHTDLVLTADHALILNGLAICAGALVNGTTITRDPKASLPDRVTYYHIETEAHDVILANGAAAETYVDYVQRSAFDNHAEYLELYGEDRTIPEMDLPRVSAARLVPPAIRARLNGEAAA